MANPAKIEVSPDLSKRPSGPLSVALIAGAIFVLTFLVFSGALRGEFVNWDDNNYILKNPHLAIHSAGDILWLFAHGYFWSYIPLTMLSHSLDYALYGFSPFGHHLTSVLLHGGNAVWVFLLALPLIGIARTGSASHLSGTGLFRGLPTGTLVGAALAAVLFALHPLKAESASWVSDRKDLLCAFFLLPSAIAYLKYMLRPSHSRARGWLVAAVVLHLLAVLSKAVALMFPFLLLLVDLGAAGWTQFRARFWALLREKVPFFAVSFVVGLVGTAVMPQQGSNLIAAGSAAEHTVLYSVYCAFHPLKQLFWPLRLSPIYDDPSVAVMLGAVVLVVLATALVLFLMRLGWRWPLLAWCAYLVLSLPTALYFLSSIQPVADRYAYLPTMPIFVFGGGAVARLLGPWKASRIPSWVGWAAAAAMGALAVVLAMLTVRQVAVWRTPLTLWQHAVTVAPYSPYVQNNLGEALTKEGYLEEALVAFRVAIEAKPDYADTYSNLGVVYLMKGDYRTGLELLNRALALTKGGVSSIGLLSTIHYNIGFASKNLGDYDGALSHLAQAIQLLPTYAEAHTRLGEVMMAKGDSVSGIQALIQGARLGDTEAQRELSKMSVPWQGAGGK